MDKEGYATIVDRKKDMILTERENVYSTEVENVLYMHPVILECAVIGIPGPKEGEAVKGIMGLKAGQNATEQDIISFVRIRWFIDFIEALPRTGFGKIQKKT
jgi:acyl-CoA synthetase (AMP-forming)/AMP-acid ligase II